MKISFKVSTQKKAEVKEAQTCSSFSKSSVQDVDDEVIESRKRNIICLENGVIKDDGSQRKKEKKEYCITLTKARDWRIDKLKEKMEDGSATEEDKARLALMLESLGESNGTGAVGNQKISNDDEFDLATGSSVDADYEAVPVEEFGLAFLRGCGWKKGEGIGRTNKKVVQLAVSEARPRGMGLGSHLI